MKIKFTKALCVVLSLLLMFFTVSCSNDNNSSKDEKEKNITVQFLNYDGTVLKSYECNTPFVPVYDGEEPIKNVDGEYLYYFNGWDKEVQTVEKDETYVAQFKAERKYCVKIKRANGEVEKIYFSESNKEQKILEIKLSEDYEIESDSVKIIHKYSWKDGTIIPTMLNLQDYEFEEERYVKTENK